MRDPLSGPIAAIVKRMIPRMHSWATILSYDPARKMAVVMTQPDKRTSLPIRVSVGALGDGQTIPVGTQVKVTMEEGSPDAIIGVFHSDRDPVPDDGQVAMEGDLDVAGTVRTSGGITLRPAHVQPDNTTMERGFLYSLGVARDGMAGTADELWWIGQKADGTWAAYRLMQAL